LLDPAAFDLLYFFFLGNVTDLCRGLWRGGFPIGASWYDAQTGKGKDEKDKYKKARTPL
jgi:hypothetical protein